MRIGIDIDGVLTDVEQFEIDYASEFYINNTNRHLDNPDGYDSYEIFNGSVDEDNLFWSKAIYDYVKEPPRRFASVVLNKLKEEGHELYIITNRIKDLSYCDISEETMKKIVIKWFNKYKLYYDKIIFTEGSKLKALKENKIDVMVDDKPKNIIELSSVCKVFCYDARCNRNIVNDNVTRVYSWYDIYDKIRNLNRR